MESNPTEGAWSRRASKHPRFSGILKVKEKTAPHDIRRNGGASESIAVDRIRRDIHDTAFRAAAEEVARKAFLKRVKASALTRRKLEDLASHFNAR